MIYQISRTYQVHLKLQLLFFSERLQLGYKKERGVWIMKKDVMILTGAGQIGMAIARRMGYGKKIVIGDKKPENAQADCKDHE